MKERIEEEGIEQIACQVEATKDLVFSSKETDKKGNDKEEMVNEELKELPNNLKYAFLGADQTLPVIIFSSLTSEQNEKLVKILTDKKKAIGWSIHDIVGISPAMCMHRIELEKDAKLSSEFQKRLNPVMQVVKNEVIKLLDEGSFILLQAAAG